ncbi:hypothetical protein [Peptostreptococcus equinus]|uniref:Uncharacterized protein n=1 Tax=Peptostreptococcus equinus TaxID=3003601 RepID=A0ABY7JSS6_9FIRM|nr:hypothetical protein [Peptostreptococcus sp. CBA3647]WAW14767.1 hypothetical protein O0R46_09305 [Peptostreptococcus sp. CBA3647]
MAGWIKIYRKILNNEFYQGLTGRQRDVIMTILLMADHESREWTYKGVKYKTEPGQLFTSLSKIAKKCGKDCTRETVRTTINNAINAQFLTIETHKTHTVISIANWERYQGVDTVITQDMHTSNAKDTCLSTTNKNIRNKEVKYKVDTQEYRLSYLLLSLIRDHNPKFKEPNMDNWCGHVDKMIRIDKRSVEEIEKVIRWSQGNDFWYKNILSTAKLREKFDQLYLQMPKSSKVIPYKNSKEKEKSDGWGYM